MAGAFDGKVVVITGGTGNVGEDVVKHFASLGAKLALWEHHAEKGEALIGELDSDVEAIAVGADLTNEEAVAAALAQTVEQFGQIDTLLHIAGGFAMPGPVHEGHLDVWNKMMALNATAVYITCSKVAAHMLEKGIQGSITVIGARNALKGSKNGAAYSASKAASLRIVQSMAEELKDHGIRVNTILPSTIDTPANRAAMGDDRADKWVKPQEIANTLAFLASDQASAITGATLEVYKRA